jgi:hypothetical protein
MSINKRGRKETREILANKSSLREELRVTKCPVKPFSSALDLEHAYKG